MNLIQQPHEIFYTNTFKKRWKDFCKSRYDIKILVAESINLIALNPLSPSHRPHRVYGRFGKCWSSRVTGDIRILWQYSEQHHQTIELLDIGTHSGKYRVYK